MKIMLTGILPSFIPTVAARLMRGGHRIIVLGQLKNASGLPKGVPYHDMHPNSSEALGLIEASGVEAVLFFFATQCESIGEYGSVQGTMLDALYAMLTQCGHCGVQRFVLITDRRVFGVAQKGMEKETPLPDTPTGVLIKAAEDCLSYGTPQGVRTLLVRVSSLYEAGDPESFFAYVASCMQSDTPVMLTGSRHTPCDFLHADDLATFLDFALGGGIGGVAHVCYGKPYEYGDVEGLMRARWPHVQFVYGREEGRAGVLGGDVAHALNWVPRHDFAREIDEITHSFDKDGRAGIKETRRKGSGLVRALMPWAELVAMGALAIAADRAAIENAILSAVDYKILYVCIIGNVRGRRFGLLAALIACLNYAGRWWSQGGDMYMLLYNSDHWLPMCCYMLCGFLFGYLSDKSKEQMLMMDREHEEIKAQNEFLQTMYHQAFEDRNQLQEQVMRFRDSYGRIYHITKELDTLQPEQIILSTLGVLEDTMQNQSVAIYVCGGDSSYARMVVSSRGMKRLSHSLNLAELTAMTDTLSQGKVFANTSLLPRHPSYAAPILREGKLQALLVMWDVPFEKQTQYLENLFSVVSGLVQSAMVRALHYFSVADDMYIANTHILTDKAFRSALGVYQNIRKRRSGQYLLVKVSSAATLTPGEYDMRIGRAVRSTDLVGQLTDGQILVLFPQAASGNLPQIEARFKAQGLMCELVSQEVAYA